jgi:hypothetical protein
LIYGKEGIRMGDIQWKNPKVTIEKIAESTVREVVSEREEKVTSHERVPLWALIGGLLIGEIKKE